MRERAPRALPDDPANVRTRPKTLSVVSTSVENPSGSNPGKPEQWNEVRDNHKRRKVQARPPAKFYPAGKVYPPGKRTFSRRGGKGFPDIGRALFPAGRFDRTEENLNRRQQRKTRCNSLPYLCCLLFKSLLSAKTKTAQRGPDTLFWRGQKSGRDQNQAAFRPAFSCPVHLNNSEVVRS
jgi:hypothetical protein